MFTVKEASKELKVHYRTVETWLIENKIKGTKIGRQWRISKEEIDYIKVNGLRNENVSRETKVADEIKQ